jgi:hypothetical protein
MMSDFTTYQKFWSMDEAVELIHLLKENGIEFEVVDNSISVDVTFVPNRDREKEVKLRKEDFAKVDELLEKIAESNLENVDKDHYLFQFSQAELLEIIQKPDEWSKDDFLLAKHILTTRGITITSDQVKELKEQRLEKLSEPESGNALWTFIGYVLALGGGVLGILIGWHLMNFKKVLPNGERVYVYTKTARKHGSVIVVLGIVCFCTLILYNLFK